MFSVGSRASFCSIMEKWSSELRNHCPGSPWVIVGNHKEKEDAVIDSKEVERLLMRLHEMRGHKAAYRMRCAEDRDAPSVSRGGTYML